MFLAVTGAAYRSSWKEQQPSSFSTTRRSKCESQDHTLADEFSVGLCMFWRGRYLTDLNVVFCAFMDIFVCILAGIALEG